MADLPSLCEFCMVAFQAARPVAVMIASPLSDPVRHGDGVTTIRNRIDHVFCSVRCLELWQARHG